MKKLFTAAAAAAMITALAPTTTTAVSPPTNHGCQWAARGDAVDASCNNRTNGFVTGNLYVDCRPAMHNPHVTTRIAPYRVGNMSTKCGFWSSINSATAWMS